MTFDVLHPKLQANTNFFFIASPLLFLKYMALVGRKRNGILQKSELFLLTLFSPGNFIFKKIRNYQSKNFILYLVFPFFSLPRKLFRYKKVKQNHSDCCQLLLIKLSFFVNKSFYHFHTKFLMSGLFLNWPYIRLGRKKT